MTRTFSSMSLASVAAAAVLSLALVGCAKNPPDTTQNPDSGADTGAGAVDGGEGGDSAATPSRARSGSAARGAGRNTKARKVTAKKPPRAPVQDTPSEEASPNGLLAEAFALDSAEALPTDFSSLGAAIQSFEVPNLDFDEVEASAGFPGLNAAQSNYAVRFTGSLNIVEEAEYELCLHSDDGSQLLLEDTLVVDNDGVHESAVEACELVYLPPGEYMLEIRYFQADGPLLTMHFAWAANGGDKVIVPTEVLFKPNAAGR